MLALAADENFNNDILRGLLRRKPNPDLVRIQDAGPSRAPMMPPSWNGQRGRTVS